jgi:hypothetical protein
MKTKNSNSLLPVIIIFEVILSYIFISLAINDGNILFYLFGFILFYLAIKKFFGLIKLIILKLCKKKKCWIN